MSVIISDYTHSLLLDLLIGYKQVTNKCYNQRTNADIWVKFRLLYSNFQALEIYVQANIASCVLGHPKCFRQPKTTCRYPPLQSRADMMILHCKHIRFMYKFYAPNNHINYPNIHSWIIKITIYLIKKVANVRCGFAYYH